MNICIVLISLLLKNGLFSLGQNGHWNNGFGDEDDFGGNGGGGGNYGGSLSPVSAYGNNNPPQNAAALLDADNGIISRRPVIVPSIQQHTTTLIFFHGMGDQGDGWAQTFQSDFAPYLRQMKFICPNAKEDGGMTSWFEYQGLDPSAPEDLDGLNAIKNYAHRLIDSEVASGIPSSRIFLGGFSQGGPVALYAGLSYPQALGGILCLSGFLLPRDFLPTPIRQIPWLNPSNMAVPIFIGHGKEDPNVPFHASLATANALRRFDPNVQFRSYPMGHTTCQAETGELIRFMQENI